jgi:hypothetical protein
MEGMSRLLYATAFFCLAVLLASIASAQSDARGEGDPCAAPDVRTDVRPDAGGPPTEVSVGIRMIDLTEINDVSQTMTGDFAVRLTWTDPRLAHLEGCEILLDDIWSPGLTFINSGRLFTSRPREAGIGPGGTVTYVQRYYGTLATYHNLHDFPFDKQRFRISLSSLEWGEKEVQLTVDEKVTGRREPLNISDWTIKGVKGVISRDYADTYDRFHSRYDFEISANRIRGYYGWKVVLPLCLIVAMSWTVFWINPARFGPQISLSATSMLTLVAFIFATTNMVPKLGYFTILDKFITASTILVFLALVQSLTTTYLFSKDKEAIALHIDHVSRFAFPLTFAALVIIVLIR